MIGRAHRPMRGRVGSGVLLLWLTISSAAQAAEWLPPVRLNAQDTEGWFPDVTTDLSGRTHVVWSSGPSIGRQDMVFYCSPTAQGCTPPTPVARRQAGDGAYVTRAAPAVDRSGVFHLLWRQKTLMVYTSVPLPDLFSPTQWSRPRKLGEGSYTALVIDERGALHAAWSQGIFRYAGGPCDPNPCYGCADIHYSRSDDGGRAWTSPVNVSQTPGGSEKPHIAFAKDGTLYIAWEEGRDHYVGRGELGSSMLSVSTDAGHTWNGAVTFTFPGDTPQSTALGVDRDDRVVVVWQQVVGEGVFFQTSADRAQTWSAAQPIAGVLRRSFVNKLDDYDVAADSQGHLHLVHAGRLAGGDARQHVLHLEWNGQQWTAPTPIFTTDGAPEWPRIAVGNGNQLHVVWFERPHGFEWKTDGKNYVIWYARGSSAAPPIAPVEWPAMERPLMTIDQWLRVAQAMLSVAMLVTVIATARRYGW